jgi:hypothetical protein
MKDSTVGGICHRFTTAGEEMLPRWGFDDCISSNDEFCFDFRSEFKKSNVVGVAIHDRNEYARSMDDCISADA